MATRGAKGAKNTENQRHYKVDCKMGTQWLENGLVFPFEEDAVAYGQCMVDTGSVRDYRLVPTDAPVNTPESKADVPNPEDDRPLFCPVEDAIVSLSELADLLALQTPIFSCGLRSLLGGSAFLGVHEVYIEHREYLEFPDAY